MKMSLVRRNTQFALILTLLLTGCAAGGLDYQGLETQLQSNNCPGALEFIEDSKEKYGANRELIYLMDAGMVNLRCGNYAESNRFLQDADQLSEDLWTKSISREAASFVINEYTIEYAGEDFEKVMISLLGALNYSLKGDYEGALVEARRINSKLIEYNDKYENKNVYSEDAFARYLSGMLYEVDAPDSLQNLDSAYIDYYHAYKAYNKYAVDYGTPLPRVFVEDFLRVAEATDRLGEIKDLASGRQWMKHSKVTDMGRLVLVYFAGKAPVKVEEAIIMSGPQGPIKLAFPRFTVSQPGCQTGELMVKAPGTGTVLSARTELVEDINAITVKNLADRKTRYVIKAVARVAIKQIAVAAVANEIDDPVVRALAKFTGSVVASVTEIADTRSWRTLPGQIQFVRTFVPAGAYEASVRLCGSVRDLGQVNLKAGETKFLLVETMY